MKKKWLLGGVIVVVVAGAGVLLGGRFVKPGVMPASPLGGKPHPRLHHTFPRVLGHYAREKGVFSLETAISRMTGLSARRFGLADRGEVREGAYADLVLFDPDVIADTGTFTDPTTVPAGIDRVWVNGVCVAADGEHTGARPGRALRFSR